MKEDKNDACRYFSISRVLPEQRPWISRKRWISFTAKTHTRERERGDFHLRWKTRREASRHIKYKAVFNLAQAIRSALIMSLEVDVGAGELPKKWPTVNVGDEKFTFGLCNLPPMADARKRLCYVNQPPARSPNLLVPEIPVVNPVNALLVAQFGNTRTLDIQIPIPEPTGYTHGGAELSVCARSYQNHGMDGIYAHVCSTQSVTKCT
jgi:hypothetical protein